MLVTEYDITSEKLSRDYNIVMLSDIHNKPAPDLLQQVSDLAPDYIFVPGDLVDRHRKTYKNVIPFLTELVKIAPVYFSPGNHEIKFPKLSARDIAATGVHVLDNKWVKVEDFILGGQIPYMTFDWIHDLEQQEGYKILLNHHPEYIEEGLADFDLDLILAGHAHGGQWVLFGKAIYAPGQGLFPKYTHGFYGNMLVGAGTTNTIAPFTGRFGNPCEIVQLKFHKA